MKKIFNETDRITTISEFEFLKSKIDDLIDEATEKGYLSTQGANNPYTKEIARLAKIGARYEDEFLNLTIGKKLQYENIDLMEPCLV